MHFTIISGSHRQNSESERISKYIEQVFKKDGQASVTILSLAGNPLPLWDESFWTGDPKWNSNWKPIAKQLKESDGFVVVSPEWSGMVPAGLKNLFLFCSTAEIGHKPALIVAVSSGMGGAYPVEELRTSSYKNTRLCYIPEHVIVRSCTTMLKGDTPASDHDASLRKRIEYSVKVLIEYGKALAQVRESGVLNYKEFPSGM
jgi:NAD(P)H-dependent FMN reductase